jgi:DNA-directed RNA polymerase specialized sigma24 family protein
MTHSDDEPLTDRAFEKAMQAAFPILCQRLTRRYGDEQLAEEVSWDCLTQAYEVWRTDPDYFANRDLTAWTSQRASWRALDRLRERGRFAPLAEEHLDDSENIHAPLIDPRDEEAARRLQRDREITFASLQQLDEQDREILERYYYDDCTDQEIGAQLYGEDGSEQARGLRIWRRRQKAHARLETILVENGIDPTDYTPMAHQAV